MVDERVLRRSFMDKKPNLATCDLAEVFSQLEKADSLSLQMAQVEIARIERDRKRQESAEPETLEAPRLYHR